MVGPGSRGALGGLLGARRGILEGPGAVLSGPWGSLGAPRRTLSCFGRPWHTVDSIFETGKTTFLNSVSK